MRTTRQLRAAERHLAAADPVLNRLIQQVGRCTIKVGDYDLFNALVRIVVGQQISGKAANAISAKIETRFAEKGLTPSTICKTRMPGLQACGLSANKARTIKELARAIDAGQIDIHNLPQLPDEQVAEQLLPIVGIGPWSVDMVLIFALGRPDVLPVGDYGLRSALKKHYGLRNLPNAAKITRLAEPWRPYRSVATWYLWRSLGPVPQSD
jgi:DNA-3-methyladenine glycosylase II